MKVKKYIQGITFFTTLQMYQTLKDISDQREISLSDLLREIIDSYLSVNIPTSKQKERGAGM